MPGDPASAMFARFQGQAQPEQIDAMRKAYGLSDAPLPDQYLTYLSHALRGDLGISISSFPAPVTEVIGTSLLWTLLLGLSRPSSASPSAACSASSAPGGAAGSSIRSCRRSCSSSARSPTSGWRRWPSSSSASAGISSRSATPTPTSLIAGLELGVRRQRRRPPGPPGRHDPRSSRSAAGCSACATP